MTLAKELKYREDEENKHPRNTRFKHKDVFNTENPSFQC
jgi:hypothetical protein